MLTLSRRGNKVERAQQRFTKMVGGWRRGCEDRLRGLDLVSLGKRRVMGTYQHPADSCGRERWSHTVHVVGHGE